MVFRRAKSALATGAYELTRPYARWCPYDTIEVRNTVRGTKYSLAPNLTKEQLEATLPYVEEQLRLNELDLHKAERKSDRDQRRYRDERSKPKASLFSVKRSTQDMQSLTAQLNSFTSESKAIEKIKEVAKLEQLKFEIEQALKTVPVPTTPTPLREPVTTKPDRYCPFCGEGVRAHHQFCAACGAQLK